MWKTAKFEVPAGCLGRGSRRPWTLCQHWGGVHCRASGGEEAWGPGERTLLVLWQKPGFGSKHLLVADFSEKRWGLLDWLFRIAASLLRAWDTVSGGQLCHGVLQGWVGEEQEAHTVFCQPQGFGGEPWSESHEDLVHQRSGNHFCQGLSGLHASYPPRVPRIVMSTGLAQACALFLGVRSGG